tara:strand:+ start:552 stop:767 length:216 start_codon:yes stop_codon:yes gene_type:complete
MCKGYDNYVGKTALFSELFPWGKLFLMLGNVRSREFELKRTSDLKLKLSYSKEEHKWYGTNRRFSYPIVSI